MYGIGTLSLWFKGWQNARQLRLGALRRALIAREHVLGTIISSLEY